MIRINLNTAAGVQKVKNPLFTFDSGNEALGNALLVGIIVAAMLFCGYQYFSLNSTRSDLGTKIASANQERERLKEILKKGEEFKAQRELLKRKVELITDLKRNQSVPVHLLDEISASLPEFLWLEQLNESGSAVSLAGKATNYNAVSNLYNNLRDSSFFVDVVLGTTQVVGQGVSFSMTCKFVNQREPLDENPGEGATPVASLQSVTGGQS